MVGILVVTHGDLGDCMVEAAEFILGEKFKFIETISINLNKNVKKLRNKINDGIKKVEGDNGVIVLTDMFGGTSSNLSYSFLEEGRVEVISGVNLPMIIKAIKDRENKELHDFASELVSLSKKSISLGSSILRGNKR